jgi:hypothetical protein
MASLETEMCFFMGQEDPKTYSQAMKSEKSEEWSKAIKDEIESLERLGTWELTNYEEDQAPLHLKWVFKTKTNADGSVERYKVQLVACGNEQEYGVNFYETLAPVMEMQPTVMTIFALEIMWGVMPEAGDIPNAYPRAQVEDWLNVHLYLPKGKNLTKEELNKLGVKSEKQVTLKLKESLYGLKQAGRLWNNMLNDFLVNKLSFQRCKTDKFMYVKVIGADIVIVGIYVDDILAIGTKKKLVDDFFEDAKQMDIKYLGEVNKFLGIRATKSGDGGVWRDQEATIKELLIKLNLQDANSVQLPIGADYEENR